MSINSNSTKKMEDLSSKLGLASTVIGLAATILAKVLKK